MIKTCNVLRKPGKKDYFNIYLFISSAFRSNIDKSKSIDSPFVVNIHTRGQYLKYV